MFNCLNSYRLALAVIYVICSYARLLHISLNYFGFWKKTVRHYYLAYGNGGRGLEGNHK